MKKIVLICLLLINLVGYTQVVKKIEPPNWWAGMKNTELQLLIYGEKIADFAPVISNKDIALTHIQKGESENYVFLTLDLSKAKPGEFSINFNKKGRNNNFSVKYELKERVQNSGLREGFNSSDVVYLITPDRFANGNEKNDINKALNEKTINRAHDYARHGGDIAGITNNLDYLEKMGFTAIWPSPLLTNDMKNSSYHGYAMTDFYQVDPRFGTLEEYIQLSEKASEKGIKLIMDQVANHCGSEHWWMKDLPFSNWINYQNDFLNGETVITNHRRTVNQDRYASQSDKKLMNEGWFVSAMPDLNQQNPFMAKYLIQNSIWWVETLNLGGIRQDTYPYPDKDFMSNWAGAIMNEYPNFSIVGEEWSYNPLLVGYWQQGANNFDNYNSNLTSTMDFPMQQFIVEALNEDESWGTGLVKMYEGLANDFYYSNPSKIMGFLDNHDMDRIFTQLKHNVTNTKMALTYLLMLPRIPQIYYGTEILMENSKKPGDHGLIRTDFPGGWKNDKINAFSGAGLSQDQLDMQNYLSKVLNFRKNSEAIHSGKTIHFGPQNGVYVLFRILNDEVVTLILNKNNKPVTLDLSRFNEIGLNGKNLKNVLTNEFLTWDNQLKLNTKGATVLTSKF
jgi:glycosidase